MTNTNQSNCPKCAAAIPEDAPRGLCPQCVLEGVALASKTIPTSGRNTAPPTIAEIAPHFPELEIIELLGAGGMGAVYKARQPKLDRVVAVKILSHDLASDPAFAERFNREARVLARLSHPNIVGIFDFGTAGPLCYLLMEYVDGVNLRQAMQAGRFSPSESLAMVEEICNALKFAHEEGILHRDIKPENVLIDSKGRVKIADFGIAKLVGEDERSDVTLTMHGSVLGSPHYMSPEQIETPGDVDQRADIYSLGVVFYELLTGELPIGRFALPSEKANMDARIDEIVMRTLEKERQARFQSVEEVMTQVGLVTQSPESARTAHAPTQSDDPGTARFSLASAIFTGISLIVLILSIIVANADVMPRKLEYLVSMLILGLSGCLGIVGLILGSVALKEIRKSGGQKSGLGSAVFGVVAWPVLMMGLISTLFLLMPMPVEGASRASFGPFAIMLFVVVPQILGAFIIVRGLRRWAGGVPTSDGGKNHPGLTRTVLGVIGLIILGPVLAEVAVRIMPASGQHDRFSEMEREMEREMKRAESLHSSLSSSGVLWFRGSPEVEFPFVVSPGFNAELRLVRYDAEGIPKYAEIGAVERFQAKPAIKTKVKIGTSGPDGKGFESERGFTALFLYGQDRTATIYGESDFAEWKFESMKTDSTTFNSPGKFDFQIAERRDEKGEVTGVLKLEIIVTKE